MSLEVSGHSLPVSLGQGRSILYDLYAQKNPLSQKNDLQNKIDQFISDLEWFDRTCKMILDDEMPAVYSFKCHQFINEDELGPFDPLESKRDFLVHGIKELAKRLISPYEEELGSEMKTLEFYLSNKLLKGTSFASLQEFIAKGSQEETLSGQNSLLKLFGKIKGGKFLSVDQKQQKLLAKQTMNGPKDSPKSQAEGAKADSASAEPVLEVLASPVGNLHSSASDTTLLLDLLIKKIEKRKVHSAEGKELKKGLIQELKVASEHLLANKEISGLEFKVLYNKKVRNIVPDELYDEIQTLGETFKSSGSAGKAVPKEGLIVGTGAETAVAASPQIPHATAEDAGEKLSQGPEAPLAFSMPPVVEMEESAKTALKKDEEIQFSSTPKPNGVETEKEIPEAKKEEPLASEVQETSPWAKFWEGVKSFFLKVFAWFSWGIQKLFSW